MVAIIDDREDVWNFQPNVVHVKPYLFFEGTADINAPPALKKDEPVGRKRNSKIIRVPKIRNKASSDSSSSLESGKEPENTIQGIPEMKSANELGSGDNACVQSEESETTGTLKQVIASCEKASGIAGVDSSKTKSDDDIRVSDKDATKDNGQSPDCRQVVENKEPESSEEGVTTEHDKEQSSKDVTPEVAKGEPERSDNANRSGEPVEPGIPASQDQDLETEVKKLKMDVEDSAGFDESEHDTSQETVEQSALDGESKHDTTQDSLVSLKGDEDYDELIEWEDEDDYLLYLEDILRKVHTAYYEVYDQTKNTGKAEKPDLKKIIPYVRRKILKGANILFSGVFPRNMPPERSRAFTVAKALGANVQAEFVPKGKENATTHVIAAQLGTVKVQMAVKQKGVHVLTVDWLWTCNDRWERVDERLFRLNPKHSGTLVVRDSPDLRKMRKRKRKRSHNHDDYSKRSKKKRDTADKTAASVADSPEAQLHDTIEMEDEDSRLTKDDEESEKESEGADEETETPTQKNMERQFSETLSPLISFSKADLDSMDREVEDILDEPDSDDSEVNEQILRKKVLGAVAEESSSEESLSGDLPRGWKLKKKYPRKKLPSEEGEEDEEELEAVASGEVDQPHRIFKHSDQSSSSDNSEFNESVGSVDEEMAAAVEREFLGF